MQKQFRALFVLITLLASLSSARARDLLLAWNPSADSGVTGYNIYYGTNSHDYSCKINVSNVTDAVVSNLTAGITYYFSATA